MGNSNAAVGIEMPGYASDLKGVKTVGTIKGGRNAAQTVISDFKKKLDSLSAAGQPAVVQTSGALPENMAAGATAQEPLQMGVGILEGFGLLDGQTDIGAADAVSMGAQAAEAAGQAQTSGQFARMLDQEQPGATAAEIPQQPNAGIGEYSGSLESTSRTATDTAGAETAMQQLQSKVADDTAQPEAHTGTQGAAAQQEAQAVAQPAAAQPGTQTIAAGTEAEQPATEQSVTAELVGGDTQKQPAAESAPAAATIVNADGTAARALQSDAPVQADTAAGTISAETESAFVRDNVIRIVDKASTHVREGKYEFDVDLKPDFMGKVSIRLTMQDGEIRMYVRVEDPKVGGMFSDQANALASAMKEKGIVLSGVDISYQDPMTAGSETFTQSGNGGGGQRRENQIGWTTERYSSEAFETLTPISELLGGSSVEYLA